MVNKWIEFAVRIQSIAQVAFNTERTNTIKNVMRNSEKSLPK